MVTTSSLKICGSLAARFSPAGISSAHANFTLPAVQILCGGFIRAFFVDSSILLFLVETGLMTV